MSVNYLNQSIKDLSQLGKEKQDTYIHADPFPNITLDDFFDEAMLGNVADEFPDLAQHKNVASFTYCCNWESIGSRVVFLLYEPNTEKR